MCVKKKKKKKIKKVKSIILWLKTQFFDDNYFVSKSSSEWLFSLISCSSIFKYKNIWKYFIYTVKPRYKGGFCIHRRLVDKFYSLKSLISNLYLRELFLSTCPLFYYNIISPKIKKRTVLGTNFFY
jgi:hypothetical protein